MTLYAHVETQENASIEARLCAIGDTAYESVERITRDGARETLHEAEFPLRNLGSASRQDYLTVMTASILGAEVRARRLGITTAQALSGHVPS